MVLRLVPAEGFGWALFAFGHLWGVGGDKIKYYHERDREAGKDILLFNIGLFQNFN